MAYLKINFVKTRSHNKNNYELTVSGLKAELSFLNKLSLLLASTGRERSGNPEPQDTMKLRRGRGE